MGFVPLRQADRLPALVLQFGKSEVSFQRTLTRSSNGKNPWLDFTSISGREPLPRQQDRLCGWGMVQVKRRVWTGEGLRLV